MKANNGKQGREGGRERGRFGHFSTHRLEVVWIGSGFRDLTSSAEAVRYLIEDRNITLLLGMRGSRNVEVQGEVALELNATMVTGSALVSSVFQDPPSVFGLQPSSNTRFRPTFELLNNSSSWASRPTMTTATRPRTVAYWYSGTDWRQGVCEQVPDLADEFNFTVLAGIYEENMTSLVEQLIALDADAIIGCGDCEDFLLECEIQGLAPMLHSFAGCFLDELGEEARFATAAVTWLSSVATKETFLEDMTALEFYDEFIDLFDAVPTHVAAGEWGALSVLVQAIEAANSTEAEAVAEVLRDIHVDTLFGEVAFDENGMASRSYFIAQRPFTGNALHFVAPPDDPGVVKAIFPAPTFLERECYSDAVSLYGESGGVCSLCAIGDISVLTGQLDEYGSVSRTCQGCDIGRYSTSSQSDTGAENFCKDCETGRYMNVTGVSACLYCATGTFADETASTTCRACAPGSSTATLGTVICNNCSVGTYQKVSGQTSCVSCNAGFFVPSLGQTACQACEPGFANDQEEANLCYSCSSGMYSSLFNQTSCSGCDFDTYYNGTGATACTACGGDLETALTFSTMEEDCRCPGGKYSLKDTTCIPCPSGMQCEAGSEPSVEAGYWAEVVNSDNSIYYSVYRCRDVTECLEGVVGENCARGREGLSCAVCKPDMTSSTNSGECLECSGQIVQTVAVFVLGTLLVAALGLGMVVIDVSDTNRDLLTLLICAGQFVVLLQSLTVLERITVVWPEVVGDLLQFVATVFSPDSWGVACILTSTPHTLLFGKLLMFPAFVALLFMITFFHSRLTKVPLCMDNFANSSGMVFSMFYLVLAVVSLEPFVCRSNPNGTRFWAVFPVSVSPLDVTIFDM